MVDEIGGRGDGGDGAGGGRGEGEVIALVVAVVAAETAAVSAVAAEVAAVAAATAVVVVVGTAHKPGGGPGGVAVRGGVGGGSAGGEGDGGALVVRSVVEVATEAASVVKVVAAEEVTAVGEGGGRGGAPIATPNHPLWCLGGGYGLTTQPPRNQRCSKTPVPIPKESWAVAVRVAGNCPLPDSVWSPARTRGLSEERRDRARTLRGTCVQPREQWRAVPVAGGRRILTW